MPIHISSVPGGIALAGELDMETVPAMEEAATSTNSTAAVSPFVLDLRGLTFMDSTGICAVLRLAERMGGREIVLRGARGEVARVIELTGIERFPGIQVRR